MKDYDKRNEILTLVDENDNPVGREKRGKVHTGEGLRHRAIHVMVFNRDGQILLARRHPQKLFGELWDGTIATHPLGREPYKDAVVRRLKEELGVENATPVRVESSSTRRRIESTVLRRSIALFLK